MGELDYKESWAPKNWCFWTVVLEKTSENPLDCKEIQPVHPKGNQSWIFTGRTDVEAETPILWPLFIHLKRCWCWKRLKVGREGDDRGWDGWMASPTHWTWVWVNSGSWWWTRKPGVLQSMGLQRVRHDRATGLNWTVFLEISCFFHDPTDVSNLISGSSAFSKSSLNICKFMVHILLKPGLENFEHYFASVWNECNRVKWALFGIVFLWGWNENWPFPVL